MKKHENNFSEEELIDLTLAVITINSYNHINIAFALQLELTNLEHSQYNQIRVSPDSMRMTALRSLFLK